MRIEFHRTRAERKELVNALGEILECRAQLMKSAHLR